MTAGLDRHLFEALASQMAGETSEELAYRVRDAIPVTLPGDWHPEATQRRIVDERALAEAYMAARELEKRAGGSPEPIRSWEGIPEYLIAVEQGPARPTSPSSEGGASGLQVRPEVTAGAGLGEDVPAPPAPDWWDKPLVYIPTSEEVQTGRHPLADIEEVEVVELDPDQTMKVEELKELILGGMPHREEEGWHVPDPTELALAHAALNALLRRVEESDE